ncbi:hypothetical protein G3570_00660 [Balneolaceae bacterium YR4-1]|uniref:Uncharacterized protein n=1 Tax=Halalkalibaculum roseum TaxID=2709311 RepID=A0A6M1SZ34_9BACT|nr:hypothetical protein [Halalkalibaculum roseum]NGP75125.1 hypothetical protein [Halalkalibaculum roseum]
MKQLNELRRETFRLSNALLCVLIASVLVFSTACDSPVVSSQNMESTDQVTKLSTESHRPEVAISHDMLARIRSATAKYHDVRKAEIKGYGEATPFIPFMGYHYINGGLMDLNVNITMPEALVYVHNPADPNSRRLVAVEYLVPDNLVSSEEELPDLFPGDHDHWHHVEDAGVWGLHAWVWYPNPEGVFHDTNPRVGTGD